MHHHHFSGLLKKSVLGIGLFLGSNAMAWHYSAVRAAAHEMADAAEHAHIQAEADRHHFSRYEDQAVSDLHSLQDSAEHLHHQVESYREDQHHTQHDFERLARDYNDANYSMRRAHFGQHVMRDWRRVQYAYQTLADEYYEGDDHGGGHGDHGDMCLGSGELCGRRGSANCCSGVCVARPGPDNNFCR